MRVAVKPEDKSLSYYKYFEREKAAPAPERLNVLNQPGNPGDALSIHARNRLFDRCYLPDEFGYYLNADGSAQISNRTFMPGVSGEMLDWWFAWHPLYPLRYSIWDNEEHLDLLITDDVREKIVDPAVPMDQKHWDVTHNPIEQFGDGTVDSVFIHFADPHKFGMDMTRYKTDECSFLICANIETPIPGGQLPVVLIHIARPVAGGVEYRTRFWFGWRVAGGEARLALPEGMRVPQGPPRPSCATISSSIPTSPPSCPRYTRKRGTAGEGGGGRNGQTGGQGRAGDGCRRRHRPGLRRAPGRERRGGGHRRYRQAGSGKGRRGNLPLCRVETDAGHPRRRGLPHQPGGLCPHEGKRRRQNHLYGLAAFPRGLAAEKRLLLCQARPAGPQQGAGEGGRALWHPHLHRLPGVCEDAAGGKADPPSRRR